MTIWSCSRPSLQSSVSFILWAQTASGWGIGWKKARLCTPGRKRPCQFRTRSTFLRLQTFYDVDPSLPLGTQLCIFVSFLNGNFSLSLFHCSFSVRILFMNRKLLRSQHCLFYLHLNVFWFQPLLTCRSWVQIIRLLCCFDCTFSFFRSWLCDRLFPFGFWWKFHTIHRRLNQCTQIPWNRLAVWFFEVPWSKIR